MEGLAGDNDFVRAIQNLTMLRDGKTGAELELELSKGDGNPDRSLAWPGCRGELMFSSVGLAIRDLSEVKEILCADKGTGYGN